MSAMPDPSTPCKKATPRGGPPAGQVAGQVAFGRLLPLWTPHAVRLSLEKNTFQTIVNDAVTD
jgi:hypothetical protein